MKITLSAALAALLLAGCAGAPEPVKIQAAVAEAPPPPEFPSECDTEPAEFPRVPISRDRSTVSGETLLRTLDKGREAWRVTAKDKIVCRAAVRALRAPKEPPQS